MKKAIGKHWPEFNIQTVSRQFRLTVFIKVIV